MRSAHDIYDRVGVELETLNALGEKSPDLAKIRTVYKNLRNDDLDIMPRKVSLDLQSFRIEPLRVFKFSYSVRLRQRLKLHERLKKTSSSTGRCCNQVCFLY